jgi:hypothetical protein
LLWRELRQEVREIFHTALTAALHDAAPLCGCVEPVDTPVEAVALASDKLRILEGLHDSRHCRRPYLLGRRELTKRAGAAEHKHRQRRELGRRGSGRRIFAPDAPEHVDRGRMEAVGSLD